MSLPSSMDGPTRMVPKIYVPESVNDVKEHVTALFNSFSSIDQCLEVVEKLRRDLQRARSWVSSATEIMAEWGLSFTSDAVHSCYLDTHLVRELLTEAKEKRESIWQDQMKQIKNELQEAETAKDKDSKKIAAIKKKLENLEGSCTAVQDGEPSITKVQDGSTRVYLRESDKCAVDLDGRDVTDLSTGRSRDRGRAQFLTDRLQVMLTITYVEPDVNVGYMRYRALRDQLESHNRQLLSVQGRLTAQAKKEEERGGENSQEQKQEEIDRRKKELSEAKNASLQEFRKIYEKMGPDKTGGAWKTKGRGGGKGSGAKGSGKAGNTRQAGKKRRRRRRRRRRR